MSAMSKPRPHDAVCVALPGLLPDNVPMNEDTVERIEMKIAYLERANHELSEVVYRQQQQIDALHAQLSHLSSRMTAALNEPTVYSAEQERPPHY